MKVLLLIGLLMALLFASFNLFSRDRVTRITGVVTALSVDSITVDAAQDIREGITVRVIESTLFIRDGRSASWRDLKVGVQADIRATSNGDGLYALNVHFEKEPARGHTESSPWRGSRTYDACLRFGDRQYLEGGLLVS